MKSSKPALHDYSAETSIFSVLDLDAAIMSWIELSSVAFVVLEESDGGTWLFHIAMYTPGSRYVVVFDGLIRRWEGTYTRVDYQVGHIWQRIGKPIRLTYYPPRSEDDPKSNVRSQFLIFLLTACFSLLLGFAIVEFGIYFLNFLLIILMPLSPVLLVLIAVLQRHRIHEMAPRPDLSATFIAPFQAAGIVAYSPEEFTKEIIRAEAFYSVSDAAVFGKAGRS